jgi:hypothetical protein
MPVTHFDIGNVKKKIVFYVAFFIFVLPERQQL